MTVTIASEPAPGKPRNEDIAFFLDGLACVLDGASLPREMSCGHDSAWYVRALAKHLIAAYTEEPSSALTEVLREAIDRGTGEHERQCEQATGATRASGPGSGDPMRAAATVVLARRRGESLDYLVLCDSALLVAGEEGPRVVTDERISRLPLRAGERIQDLLAAGGGYGEEYQRLVAEQVRELDAYRNVEGGYWIAADDPAAADQALTGTVPAGEVALVTDGVSRAVTALGVYSEWDALMNALRREGPRSVIAGVRAAERADPEGRLRPRGSPYDDATALVWRPER